MAGGEKKKTNAGAGGRGEFCAPLPFLFVNDFNVEVFMRLVLLNL